ncbi:MAG: low molecular weight phosphotyrosine protein phosphatase [Lachnospiraceae bacterium]|nr:low molecular weight phosphotyrosine protein phosphatase [Lachnospiraceae bacterium]
MIKILFVCHGNICRSPMAEFMMKDMVEKLGVSEDFYIASAATSSEEVWNGQGSPVYPPAREELKRHGIGKTPYTDFRKKRAVQVTRADYDEYDYLLCAESRNIRNTERITGGDPDHKIFRLLDFSEHPRDIADPWYTGVFDITYRDIKEGLEAFLRRLGYGV